MRRIRSMLWMVLAGCSAETADRVPAPDSSGVAVAVDSLPAPPDPAPADQPLAPGTLCPDPQRPCPGFKPHDLSFVLPSDSLARAEVRSDTFFAVILRSGPRCTVVEAERSATQAAFPDRKVFAERAMCEDDVENNVAYTGVVDSVSFLAVYAGRERAQADSVLAAVAGAGRHPGANLRRMQVVFMYP